MGVISLSPARKESHSRWFCENTKTLDMTSTSSANISVRVCVCVPKSERCSALRRSAPAGLLKKCGALNLPNYRRFGCEGETKAENYTCRTENKRERADNKEERDRERQTQRKQDNDVSRMCPPERERESKRERVVTETDIFFSSSWFF